MSTDADVCAHVKARFRGIKTRQECTMTRREEIARAAFMADWPKDTWERLGPGHAQDRYLRMAGAILALPAQERTDTSDLFDALTVEEFRNASSRLGLYDWIESVKALAATAITERDDTIIRQAAEIERLKSENSEACESIRWSEENRNFQATRAETAERKLDEAHKFIRRLDCECDPAFSTRICGRCAALTEVKSCIGQ